MVEVSALLFTLLSEGFIVLILFFIVMLVISVKRKSKDREAAKQLVDHIKLTSDDRTDSIKKYIVDASGIEGDELLLQSKKIDRLEKNFFTQLIRLYLKRDHSLLPEMDVNVQQIIEAYKSLLDTQGTGANVPQDESVVKEVASLKQQKEALEIELKITKSTMANMLSEFNGMFNGGDPSVENPKSAELSELAENSALEEAMQEPEEITETAKPQSIPALEDVAEMVEEEVVEEEVVETNVEDSIDLLAEEDFDIDDISFDGVAKDPIDEAEVQPSKKSASEPKPEPATDEELDVDDLLDEIDFDESFGEIVSTDDVDELLEGIDLSEDIDIK
ncbi:MAG: hypothetical protein ISR69_04000 [Gammaproteobacteria bacterium]|nr:hypothetical protein [Gammaproteobacteria bacterium]